MKGIFAEEACIVMKYTLIADTAVVKIRATDKEMVSLFD